MTCEVTYLTKQTVPSVIALPPPSTTIANPSTTFQPIKWHPEHVHPPPPHVTTLIRPIRPLRPLPKPAKGRIQPLQPQIPAKKLNQPSPLSRTQREAGKER
jgi:hypothetical protein